MNYLCWVPQEAHPEIRTQGQVVYLGDDPRKQQHGERERATQKGRQPIKGMWQASDCYGQVELSIPGGTGRLQRTGLTLSQWKERKLGESSTNTHPSLGGAVSRDTNSLGLPGHPACWPGVLPQSEQSPHSESHRCSNEHPLVYREEC